MDEEVAFGSEGRGRDTVSFSADIRGQEVSAASLPVSVNSNGCFGVIRTAVSVIPNGDRSEATPDFSMLV